MKIAIDAMGGDNGLDAVIPAVNSVLRNDSDLNIVLVGDRKQIEQSLKQYSCASNRLEIVHASEVVTMNDSPGDALRYKKDSSMRRAIDLVKEGYVQACVSAGNTGALLVISKFVLKTINNISRPAIASPIPSKGKIDTKSGLSSTIVLDLGANINCTAINLYQFALMGSIFKQSIDPNLTDRPRVALLNIGEEEHKGTDVIHDAAELISMNKSINYVGYIEGHDLYNNTADVVVCDGFIGNIALKTSEGLSNFIKDIVKDSFNRNLYSKIVSVLAWPVLNNIKNKLDTRNYNGASFLGLNDIVVKSHGRADSKAFASSIMQAKKEYKNNVIEKLKGNSSFALRPDITEDI